MTRDDIRSFTPKERLDIRKKVVEAYRLTESVSVVARQEGVNRQFVHKCISAGGNLQEEKRGRQTPSLRKPKFAEVMEATSKMRHFGIESPLWSAKSIRKLIHKNKKLSLTPYTVRKLLHEYGFPTGQQVKELLQRSYRETEGLSAQEYAHKYSMRCFFLTLIDGKFLSAISSRGDIRFISTNDTRVKPNANWLIELLYSRSKKKLLIIYDSQRLTIYENLYVPKSVLLVKDPDGIIDSE